MGVMIGRDKMKREANPGQQMRRVVTRLGYSIAAGLIVGAILGVLVDNLLLGISLGSALGLAVGIILSEHGQAARLRLGDPDRQRVVALVISTLIFLLFVGLLWCLLVG